LGKKKKKRKKEDREGQTTGKKVRRHNKPVEWLGTVKELPSTGSVREGGMKKKDEPRSKQPVETKPQQERVGGRVENYLEKRVILLLSK